MGQLGQVGQLGAAGDLGPELDTFTVRAEVEDLGLTLELWPPAPKVLVRRVQREGWAMKAGIKAGYQLLMVQKQSLQNFQDTALKAFLVDFLSFFGYFKVIQKK